MLEGLSELGLLSQILLVFIAGIGTSLTPCVYPLIPVTLALFGANDSTSRLRSFLLASTYVFGIAVTFCLLGLLSATTGALFGSILSYPPVILALSAIMIVLGCSSLDLVHLPFLNTLQGKACKVGSVGFTGAFLAGTVCGIVASPCVGPALVAILVFVARDGDIIRGTALLLSFALGMGVLFILLGTFSGLIQRIPRSGHWMNIVKFVMAVALFFYALFLLQPLTPTSTLHEYLPFSALLFWFFLALLALVAYAGYKYNSNIVKLLSSLLSAALLFMLFTAPSLPGDESLKQNLAPLTWHHSFEQSVQIAKREKKPIFVDLYADWCVACKELEKITFKDPAVRELLSQFVLAKIDFTTPTEETDNLSETYGVVGLPWLFATDESGTLIEKSTITGYVDAREFELKMKETLKRYRALH